MWGMKNEVTDSNLELSKWIIEKYWLANEGMMQRASTLAGLLGIELGFLGSLNVEKFNEVIFAKYLLVLASVALVLSIAFLVISIRDKEFEFPTFDLFASTVKKKTATPNKNLVRFLLSEDDKSRSLYRNLERENEQISKYFTRGTNSAILAQIILAIAFGIKWVS